MHSHTLSARVLLVLAGVLALSFGASADPDDADPRDVLPGARISLIDAIAAAEKAVPGRAVEAELAMTEDHADPYAVFDVDILTDAGAIIDVIVNAQSGAVESSRPSDDDAREAAAHRRLLRHARRTLAELIAEAQRIVHGSPVSAEYDPEDGPECDIILAVGDHLIEVGFDAASGRLIEVELVSDWHDHDDDDDDEDED